jgi:hypothetical protein
VTNPLSTLESDLSILVSTTGQPQPVLNVAGEVLSLLADGNVVPKAIADTVSGVYKTIGDTINNDAVAALTGIVTGLNSVSNPQSISAADVASALTSLQNVLQTAQSLVPGGSSAAASAFASTSQFATLFGSVLAAANGSITAAGQQFQQIAEQLGVIASTFTTAAAGNP